MNTMNLAENHQISSGMPSGSGMQPELESGLQQKPDAERVWRTLKIASLLRWSGSILIVLSAVSFLIQGAENILPAYRYWVALAFILLLCGCGLVCAFFFRETKGARIFFAMAAAFLPVQVSQVSAMIHGYLQGGSESLQLPLSWWQFADVSLSAIAINILLTAVVSVPVVYGVFSILARKFRGRLGLVYAAVNIMLLLPFRDTIWMELMIAGGMFWLRKVNGKLSRDTVMRLPEGIAASTLLWIPVLIMIGRSFLYSVSFLLPSVLLWFTAVWLIMDVKKAANSKWLIMVSEWAGVVAIFFAWMIVVEQLDGAIRFNILLLPFSAILFVLSEKLDYFARFYRTAASILAAVICLTVEASGMYFIPLISISMGILLGIAGIRYREKAPGIAGVVCFVSGIWFYFDYVVRFYQSSPWLSSTMLGLAVLILASYIESREKQIVQKTKFYYNEIKMWN